MPIEITIIIPTKDRPMVFNKAILSASAAIKNIQAEIIVVNDSKTSQPEIPANNSKIKLINNPRSGVAAARNLGASLAQAPLLLFMDDDMIIAEDNIYDILNTHKKNNLACANLNWLYPPELIKKIEQTQFGRFLIAFNFTTSKGWYNHSSWNDLEIFESPGITSQFLLIPKVLFDKAGGYDERFPHSGFEDFDFGKRLLQMGVKCFVNPLSIIYHNEADRIEIVPWMDRKARAGETRQVAVKLGYHHLIIKHSALKKFIYRLLIPAKPLLYLILKVIPNNKFFDFLYFRITNLLLGIYLFEGYIKKL